ncbi:hypothetical protein JTE90_003689 [Oedothorax gibbosus]|uniref:Major facilitator superfamily (MFS) profile domain-containing protein n=1 Tax=Oedothorax gibbosus TaxID=931172 RepID=A0AAV6VT93_9ARAC|nr:hypothetical protein JTE90_003689 [Oedothorax gibbosus]
MTADVSWVKCEAISNEKNNIRLGISKEDQVFSVDDAVNKVGFGKFQKKLIFLASFGWLADAFEIFILSVIGDLVACDWILYRWQSALLSSIVFAGIMIGSPILGFIADIYGRKKCLCASVVLVFVFGSASAVTPSFAWMAIFRSCLGVSLGGIAQAVTLCSEYCPNDMRGKTVFYMCYLWSFGSLGVILLTWVVMEYTNNWRLLLALAAVPSLIVIFSLKFYPESARYHLVSGQYDKACAIVAKMAGTNRRDLPPGKLVRVEVKSRGRLRDLLSSEHRRTSLLLWLIWFGSAFAYYGIIFISPMVIKHGGLRDSANKDVNLNLTSIGFEMLQVLPCVRFTQQDYVDMLLTTAAEFPGILIYTFLIEKIDRKKLLGFSCLVSSMFCMLLLMKTHRIAILTFLFISRGILVAIFQLNYVITSEVYPTTVRAVGMGAGTAFCRLGGLIVPYFAQVLLISSPVTAICLLSGMLFASGVAAACLPLETRGRGMKESSAQLK